jgi:autophagy-related protein 13
MRSNSLREGMVGSRPRAGSNLSTRESASSPTMEQPGPPAESIKKLDQIVQVRWIECSLSEIYLRI